MKSSLERAAWTALAAAVCALCAAPRAHAKAGARLDGRKSVREAMRKVFDWQVANPVKINLENNNLWARAALYAGVVAAYRATGDAKYLERALLWGEGRG